MVHEGNRSDLNLGISAVEPMQGIAYRRSERDDTVIIRELSLDTFEVRGVKEGVDRQADDLGTGCRAREPDGRRVDEDHPFPVMDEDAVGSQFNQLVEAFPNTGGVTPTRAQKKKAGTIPWPRPHSSGRERFSTRLHSITYCRACSAPR